MTTMGDAIAGETVDGAVRATRSAARRRPPWARHHLWMVLRMLAVAIAVVGLLRGVDCRQAAATLATADVRWLAVGALLSLVSLSLTAVIWGLLLHRTDPGIRWSWIAVWHARTVAAGQLIPTGAAGDAVRVVAGRRVVPTGPAVAGALVTRLAGGLGLAAWAVTGTILLRGALGPTTLIVALSLAGVLLAAVALIVCADLWVEWVGHRRGAAARRLHHALAPISATLGDYRRDPALLAQCLLLGIVSWGVNLAALSALGRSVGAEVGWQVFAVLIPVTLTATLVPLSANGIGIREGILIGVLGHAGVAAAPAAALALLVDVQMLPFAAAGALLWLGRASEAPAVRSGSPELVPVVVAADP